jgi:hypothetical protein
VVRLAIAAVILAGAVAVLPAQRGTRLSTAVQCAGELGAGVKTKRTFCDVLSGASPADSIAVAIPRHTGPATLLLDLHNRFTVPAILVPGALTYSRHEAIVGVMRPTGEMIGKAAVVREFRDMTDLFDQIGGGARPGGVIAVSPGPAEAIHIAVPAGIDAVGIVGISLKLTSRTNAEVYDTPGRPIAIVSNVRVQYRP